MDRKKAVGERIKTMRLSRGMSQLDLALALHCGQSTIAMYEAGKRMPDMDTIDYLADVFNVPPYAILYDEDEMADMLGEKQDDEYWQIREEFRRNPELRTLFSLTRKASKTELKQMEAFIRAIRTSNDYDETDTP